MPVTSFDRLRVEGPFAVTVVAGPPRATIDADARVVERLIARVEGRTLVIRLAPRDWGEREAAVVEGPIRVTVSTPSLIAIAAAKASVTTARLAGERVELALSDGGAIAAAAIDAGSLNAQVTGEGKLTLAGRAHSARLLSQGGGLVEARGLDAGELFVWVDGEGSADARARYTARVTVSAKAKVTVAGSPKCFVQPLGADNVRCGAAGLR